MPQTKTLAPSEGRATQPTDVSMACQQGRCGTPAQSNAGLRTAQCTTNESTSTGQPDWQVDVSTSRRPVTVPIAQPPGEPGSGPSVPVVGIAGTGPDVYRPELAGVGLAGVGLAGVGLAGVGVATACGEPEGVIEAREGSGDPDPTGATGAPEATGLRGPLGTAGAEGRWVDVAAAGRTTTVAGWAPPHAATPSAKMATARAKRGPRP